ncbi:MAG: thiol reductant ABC exporter subunit CydC [Marinibacterium sp.]
MKRLWAILRLMLRGEARAMWRGLALSAVVLLMGAALLGLSGWFITAAAAAGLAGTGAVFDVFRPSALVRFLALGRTAARYGERLTTHDATLRALSRLRLSVLSGLSRAPFVTLERIRASVFLNRVTADIDALDGIPLRLALPLLAGAVALAVATLSVWLLVHPVIGAVIGAGYTLGPLAVLAWGLRAARAPARRAETAAQALRTRLIDLVGARTDLTVYGRLFDARDHVRAAEERQVDNLRRLDAIDRQSGAALGLISAAITATALGLGAWLAATGTIAPARAAIGVFVALALAEAVAPLRRALAEYGRMVQAARRVLDLADRPVPPKPDAAPPTTGNELILKDITYRRGPAARPVLTGFSLRLDRGETVALAGPSGSGKSTVLLVAAGCLAPESGTVTFAGLPLPDWSADALRARITPVPQRHALIAGSIAENLAMADPGADDGAMWDALVAVALQDVIKARGGLDARLDSRGSGLSGGESRRLALARALLRRPDVLLLDEPTEGLDHKTALAVLDGLRAALPEAAILMAAHRPAEIAAARRVVRL